MKAHLFCEYETKPGKACGKVATCNIEIDGITHHYCSNPKHVHRTEATEPRDLLREARSWVRTHNANLRSAGHVTDGGDIRDYDTGDLIAAYVAGRQAHRG